MRSSYVYSYGRVEKNKINLLRWQWKSVCLVDIICLFSIEITQHRTVLYYFGNLPKNIFIRKERKKWFSCTVSCMRLLNTQIWFNSKNFVQIFSEFKFYCWQAFFSFFDKKYSNSLKKKNLKRWNEAKCFVSTPNLTIWVEVLYNIIIEWVVHVTVNNRCHWIFHMLPEIESKYLLVLVSDWIYWLGKFIGNITCRVRSL